LIITERRRVKAELKLQLFRRLRYLKKLHGFWRLGTMPFCKVLKFSGSGGKEKMCLSREISRNVGKYGSYNDKGGKGSFKEKAGTG
jgi:hypothetical protein